MKGFKGYIKLLSGILVFVAFLLLNLITVNFAPQDFLSVFLNSGLMMVCWVMIRDAFAEQGLISGQKDSEVKATKKEHLITSNEISTYKEDFNIWCERKNADRLKQKRIAILSGSSLVYNNYFDENGNYMDVDVPQQEASENKKVNKINRKRYKKDCRLLNKARFAYVAPYEVEEICAREDVSSKKKLFGLSVKHWKNAKLVSSVVMSLVISVMLSFVSAGGRNISQAEIMILVFELLIMAGSAFSFYFSALNFICSEWREGLIKKTRIMEEFYRNVVGTISYENDIEKEDGSIVVGKKIFKKRDDYIPLSRDKKSNKVDKTLEVVKEECVKQTNDIMGFDSRVDFLVTCDHNGNFSTYYQPMVLDSDKRNNVILGGAIHSSSTTSDSTSTGTEEDIREYKEEEAKEE